MKLSIKLSMSRKKFYIVRYRISGVAIISALLLTALAITIVASLFWQQQIQIRAVENQRLQMQKQWILRGAVDWATLILREDSKYSTIDDLTEPWAVPLADTSLDQYVQKEEEHALAKEAVLSGAIQDAQSRLNLTGLATAGKINEQQVLIFERLLRSLSIDTSLARLAANQIASTQPNESGATSRVRYLGFQQVQDLFTVAGFTPTIVKSLEDYVIFLPRVTAINANTAPQAVLSAALAPLSLADTQVLIAKRTQSSFHNLNELIAQLSGSQTTINPQAITLSTNYFLVNGRISLRQNAMQIQALVERSGLNTEVIWIREI
jgi:general secretion pathway protein K